MKDIIPGTGYTVNLGESKFTIRLYPRRLKRKFFKKRYYFGAAVSLLLLILGINYLARIQASTADFYAASCLGGWQNPQNAEGKPEADLATPDTFTDANSAVLIPGSASEIYCGGFAGDIPTDTKPTKLTVNISWTLKNAPTLPVDLTTSTLVETNTSSTASSTDSTTPSSTDSSTNQAPADQPPATDTNPPASDQGTGTDPAPATEQTTPTTDTPATPTTDSTPPPIETPTPTESTNETQPATAFFQIMRAFAAEDTTSSTDTSTIVETTSSTPTDTSSSATSTPEIAPSPDDFMEIVYTLDGVNWQNLARVNPNNWQYLNLELPTAVIQNWEDIGKIQIGLRSLSSTAETPTIYLDAITLSAEYENLPNQNNPILESTSTLVTDASSTATSTLDLNVDDLNNLASGVSYSRSPSGSVVSGPVTINFAFKDWAKDMDFTDIYDKPQTYWWIEVDSTDPNQYFSSPCYPLTQTSASPTFDLKPGNYSRVSINAANGMDNCQKVYGGSVKYEANAYGEPGHGLDTLFTVQ